MRKVILFLPLVAFIVLGGFLYSAIGNDPTVLPSAKLNKPVPSFSLPSVYSADKLVTEVDLKGEPALLNVWATWCPSCKEEHAQLNQIKAAGYTVYGINYKDDRAKAQVWLDRYLDPYSKNIFDEKGRLGLDLGVYGAPETYVLDANGIIRYKHVGVVDEAVWQGMKKLLDELKQEAVSG